MHLLAWLYCGANLLYLLAYCMQDVAKLRALTVVGASLAAPYFLVRDVPDLPALGWTLAYGLINLSLLARLRWPKPGRQGS